MAAKRRVQGVLAAATIGVVAVVVWLGSGTASAATGICATLSQVMASTSCTVLDGETIYFLAKAGNCGVGGNGGDGGEGGRYTGGVSGGAGGAGAAGDIGGAGAKVSGTWTNDAGATVNLNVEVGSDGSNGSAGEVGADGVDGTPGTDGEVGGDGSDGGAGDPASLAVDGGAPIVTVGGEDGGTGGEGGQGGQAGSIYATGADGDPGFAGTGGTDGSVVAPSPLPEGWEEEPTDWFETPNIVV